MEQHRLASTNPWKCRCGQSFTRMHTLQRHIQGTQKTIVPKYECPECPAYRAKNGFKRKDHLVQHLRHFHKYGDDQLRESFPPRQARRYDIPVCHFESCEYYRDPEFKEMTIGQQENNRPFDKQSDYTTHMKDEHDWSPYPCKIPGCGKCDGKGFFSLTAFEKHCKEKHSDMTTLPAQKEVVKKITCDYCTKSLTKAGLKIHKQYTCTGRDVTCRYCGMHMKSIKLRVHEQHDYKREGACCYCQERMEQGQLWAYKYKSC
ncbi:hypothetical protein F5X97DRAFT_126084 [Nemania serpens]|nr:hypothetical protein F5X97DRAFT_126084 [Nemania serpens]